MPIESICVGCGQRLRADEEFRGHTAACPICNREYVIGEVSQASASPTSSPPVPVQPIDLAPTWNPPKTNTLDSPNSELTPSDDLQVPDEDLVPQVAYQVMTPDGKVYGPCDEATVYSWIAQNRLNGQCAIRVVGAFDWQSIAEWQMKPSAAMEATVLQPVDSPYAKGDPLDNNPYGTTGTRPSNPYAAPMADTGTIPYPIGAPSSQAGLIFGLGLFSFLCNVCGMGIIPAVVALILASQESKKMSAGVIPTTQKGLVVAGQILALLTLLFSAGQWLLVFLS